MDCVFVLHLLLFPYGVLRTQAFASACKTDQVGFTEWIAFLPSNLVDEIGLNPEALIANT